MDRFLRFARDRHGLDLADDDYLGLHAWSIADIGLFWETFAAFNAIRFETAHSAALGATGMPGAEWFPGATVSYVEHVFRDRDPESTALVALAEGEELRELTWGELERAAAAFAAVLARSGVGPGDRVAAYLPNVPEAVI